jgi:hypothetical protein
LFKEQFFRLCFGLFSSGGKEKFYIIPHSHVKAFSEKYLIFSNVLFGACSDPVRRKTLKALMICSKELPFQQPVNKRYLVVLGSSVSKKFWNFFCWISKVLRIKKKAFEVLHPAAREKYTGITMFCQQGCIKFS